ncbi:hypothetical protein KR093_006908 [Drosophila rubida]|uniref:Large proline-rich protein BAG6 n=1 Tax=Drosophila rubida TaxID=30044 RepID=A0AAD4PJI2_9MUSC|nr:hypothetical protein KR093_006908 [Drosophila rubida]
MLINLKVKTLDARTHDFSIDNEITIRQFKDQIAEKTNIAAENQRIIYQGRVLADDKQVKEYDVDGKVLHVAERPPFSQRGANATNNDEPQRTIFRNVPNRPAPRNLRNSPYFRALDGMLVGTMAIPVNNGALNTAGTRSPPNRFPNSSSFCINRITVALHMIDCANNIAAYLENPEVGLNNQSLDILQRGRWTMESTVVEVGVSSTDNPRNNNIIDMVQDAVNAALSRNTPGRNYTVVQLPTVYTNDAGGDAQQPASGSVDASAGGANSDAGEEPTAAAAVIIEDVIVSDDEAADDIMPMPGDEDDDAAGGAAAAQATQAATGSGEAGTAAAFDAAGNGSNVAVTGIGPRRRTRPQVLANVIQRYRTVQTRLAPFVDRYYEILEQDPAFEEGDSGEQSANVAREDAQRIFDRVSEAFHYLSHAQHAISDLMLDLSQPGPRVLTCRPILVEQSGYIRSNNMFAANLPDLGSPHAHPHPPHHPHPHGGTAAAGSVVAIPINSPPNTAADALRNAAQDALAAATAAAEGRPSNQQSNEQTPQRNANYPRGSFLEGWADFGASNEEGDPTAPEAYPAMVEDPVDPPNQQAGRTELDEQEQPAPMSVSGDEAATPRLRLYVPVPLPPPTAVAAAAAAGNLGGAVGVGGAGGGANAPTIVPNIISINLPVHLMTTVHPQDRPATTSAPAAGNETATTATATATGTSEATGAASTSGGTRSGEQRANTLPTTATQTRSTARPQIQIGGNNNWAGRIAPTHTAFDRFLPCNSHHICEPAPLPQNNNNNNTITGNNNSNANANASSNNSRSNRRVISRLPRGQSGTLDMSRARRRASNSGSSNRTRSLPGLTASGIGNANANANGGGVGERNMPAAGAISNANASSSDVASRRQHQHNNPPPYSRRARLIEALSMFDNLLVTNVRNHHRAHAALGGIADVAVTVSASVPGVNAASTSPPSPSHSSSSSSSTPPSSSTGATTATGADAAAAAGSSSNSNTALRTAAGLGASDLREQLRSFLHQRVFEGAPVNEETMPTALSRALEWLNDSLLYLPQFELPGGLYNARDSVRNTVRESLSNAIELCNSDAEEQFEERLTELAKLFRRRLFGVLIMCLGGVNSDLYWRLVMRLLFVPVRTYFRGEAFEFLRIVIDPEIPEDINTTDSLRFMVRRNVQSTTLAADATQPFVAPPPLAFPTQQSAEQSQPQQLPATTSSLDSDVEMADVASSSNSSSATELEKPLPDVTVGSQPWHNNFPNDWLPVITRDLQTQTEQNRPQPPYSDAYISGMSAKRRKIIQSEKPSSSVECLIASGVQRAIQSSGLSAPNGPSGGVIGAVGLPAVNPDLVIGAIAHDPVVQVAYTEAVRANARERIKQDNDYKPSKYPQIAKFTEQK